MSISPRGWSQASCHTVGEMPAVYSRTDMLYFKRWTWMHKDYVLHAPDTKLSIFK